MENTVKGAAHNDSKFAVTVSVEGETETLTTDADPGVTIAELLKELGQKRGRDDLASFNVSVEEAEAPAATTVILRELFVGGRRGRIHLHRCVRVKVGVEYNGKTLHHEFAAANTVQRVFRWSVGSGAFNVEHDAHDLVLQLAGTTTPLAPNVHIGTLLRDRQCALALELVPKDRPQG